VPKLLTIALAFVSLVLSRPVAAQDAPLFPEHLSNTLMAKLQVGDTIVYYQCRVVEAQQKTTTDQGLEIVARKKITVTEKYTVIRQQGNYRLIYAVATLTDYPNKRFAYLKLGERKKDNWGFQQKRDTVLLDKDAPMIAALESRTHDITHYELRVNISNPNELIVAYKGNIEQYMIEGNYVLSTSLSCLK